MAKSFHCALTSFFRVKDEPAFRTWAEGKRFAVLQHPTKRTRFALVPGPGTKRFQKETYRGESGRDLADELSAYLAKGEVGLIIELGTLDQDTLGGYVIVATDGTKRCDVSLTPVVWTCLEATGLVCWRVVGPTC